MIVKVSRINSDHKSSKSELSSGTFAHFKVLPYVHTIDTYARRNQRPGAAAPPGPPPAAMARVTGTTPKKIAPRFVLAIPILTFRSLGRPYSVPYRTADTQNDFQACAAPDTRKYCPVRRPIRKIIFKPVRHPIRTIIFKPVRRPIRKNISVPFRLGEAASRGGPRGAGAPPGVN